MSATDRRWREYTGTDYYGRSHYSPAREHGQSEPPTWQTYRNLYGTYNHYDSTFKYGEVRDGWERRAWYAQREDYRERLDQLAMQILNPNR